MEEKKNYSVPRAEKVEFDYTESVEACSPWWWQNNTTDPNNGNNDGDNNDSGNGSGKQSQDDPNGQYYKCASPDYWGC